jgi:hypothetical protein
MQRSHYREYSVAIACHETNREIASASLASSPSYSNWQPQGRTIYIAFDQDSKPTTIKAVNAAVRQLGYLITQKSCSSRLSLGIQNKGKESMTSLRKHGQAALDEAYERAVPLDTWKAQSLTRLTYPPDLQVNHRYLGELPIPKEAKLIAIKSPKGTGKTQLLEGIVKQA